MSAGLRWPALSAVIVLALPVGSASRAEDPEAVLPSGVRAVWDLDRAFREKTPTRERICLNGLWRWQPAPAVGDAVPDGRWGFFKVPGCWPGITSYLQKDCQTVFAHPAWKDEKLSGVTAAWYQREIAVPLDWAGRRVTLDVEYLNSFAAVYVDGKKAGEIRFPGGGADLTAVCRPGSRHVLSLAVTALPLKAVLVSYNDTAAAREVKGSVARRGLCGDVWLSGVPARAHIADIKIDSSVRRGEIAFDVALEGLEPGIAYTLRARVRDQDRPVAEFAGKPFQSGDLSGGRFAFAATWKPERLWDLHTPQNVYHADLVLLGPDGRVLDAARPVRFGFRELWIDGRDFFLNGTRVFLSSVPLDNAQVGAAWAAYAGAKESLLRLKSFGINMVYTHHYDCEPGSHLGLGEILLAADDVGMLVALSQPHFSHYDWEAPDADASNGYARHAEYYVRVAQNHPSVVFYVMSHNAAGYNEDMNPDLIGGREPPREAWSANNAKRAQRAEAIVRRFDPGRIVYHHASGNLGVMHNSNFYPNFAPIQELCDWFGRWAAEGGKPAFTCEYGAPFTWDWTMYRGWYKGQRSFGSAKVPWEFCLAEWNAQFLGDQAFRIGEPEKANLRWEAKQFRAGGAWHRWDYPYEVGSRVFEDRHAVMGMYLADAWRAFRTWGLSANSPWEHGHFWMLRDGMSRNARTALPVDWDDLQRPGFSPDYLQDRYERMDLAYEREDWVPAASAQALLRNNRPLLAYVAGRPTRFTAKDHNVHPGETVEKQLVVINNSRETVSAECAWSLGSTPSATGSREVRVPTGDTVRIPLRFDLPAGQKPGLCELRAAVRFSTGETQEDAFPLHVLQRPAPPRSGETVALFDPRGETGRWLADLGVRTRTVEAGADLSPAEILVVGKAALTVDGPGPDLRRVRDGLRVILFEQTADVLEKRLGFRVAEYGLRQVFPRVPDHPLLAGLGAEHLRDWRGEATILPPRLIYEPSRRFNGAPAVAWCGLEVTRLWRCGTYGNVASVLIEKPARGDFLPIVDGGYSLQYSPLMVFREGTGMILFCQMDVTGRTEMDPAAEILGRNILAYVSAWKPSPARKVLYAGDPAGMAYLGAAGFAPGDGAKASLTDGGVLVVGPGGGAALAGRAADVAAGLRSGARLLAIGLDEAEANAFLPAKVALRKAEHIAACFDPPGLASPFAGVGPADVLIREPRVLPLVVAGAERLGDGVLAKAEGSGAVFCQMAPWSFAYQPGQYNVKRTFRRTAFLVSRLLANLGAAGSTPILERVGSPVKTGEAEKRWLEGLYLDTPEEWDDPYRFFRW